MRADRRTYIPLKIVIAGGFGVGKTTMVQALSEIPPLVTEEALTTASVGLDDVSAVPGKTTTTVAMDFGRISMDDLVLYLFGTPGQDRFWFMWDELARGSGSCTRALIRLVEHSLRRDGAGPTGYQTLASASGTG